MQISNTWQALFKNTRALVGGRFFASADGSTWRLIVTALAEKCGSSYEEADHFLKNMRKEKLFYIFFVPARWDSWEPLQISQKDFLVRIGSGTR